MPSSGAITFTTKHAGSGTPRPFTAAASDPTILSVSPASGISASDGTQAVAVVGVAGGSANVVFTSDGVVKTAAVTVAGGTGGTGGTGGDSSTVVPTLVFAPAAGDRIPRIGRFYTESGGGLESVISSPALWQNRIAVTPYFGAESMSTAGTDVTDSPPWVKSATGKARTYVVTGTPSSVNFANAEATAGMTGWDETGTPPGPRFAIVNYKVHGADVGKKIGIRVSKDDGSVVHDFGEFTMSAGDGVWGQFTPAYTDDNTVPLANKYLSLYQPASGANQPASVTVYVDNHFVAGSPPVLSGVHPEIPLIHDKWGVRHQLPNRNFFLRSGADQLALDGADFAYVSGSDTTDPMGHPVLRFTLAAGGYRKMQDMSGVTAAAPYISGTDGRAVKLQTAFSEPVMFADVHQYFEAAGGAMPGPGVIVAHFDRVGSGPPIADVVMVRDSATSGRRRANGGSWYRARHMQINDVARVEGTFATTYSGTTGDAFTLTNGDASLTTTLTLTAGNTVAQMVASINTQLPADTAIEAYVTTGGFVGFRSRRFATLGYRQFTLANTSGTPLDHLGIVPGTYTRGESLYVALHIKTTADIDCGWGECGITVDQYTDTRQLYSFCEIPPHTGDVPVDAPLSMAASNQSETLSIDNGFILCGFTFHDDVFALAEALDAQNLYTKRDWFQGGPKGHAGGSVEGQFVRTPGGGPLLLKFNRDIDPDDALGGVTYDNTSANLPFSASGQIPVDDLSVCYITWQNRRIVGMGWKGGLGGTWQHFTYDVPANFNGQPVTFGGYDPADSTVNHTTAVLSGDTTTGHNWGTDRDNTGHNSGHGGLFIASKTYASGPDIAAYADPILSEISTRWAGMP